MLLCTLGTFLPITLFNVVDVNTFYPRRFYLPDWPPTLHENQENTQYKRRDIIRPYYYDIRSFQRDS